MSVPQTASKSVLHDLISTLETPVLFANLNEGSRPRLTLHTAMSGTGRGLHREAKRALSEAGIEVRCKVKEHDEKRLLKTASLDRLVREFGRDSIVFDPTGGIGRARAVVRCAARIRGTLGAGLAGIYLEPWRRTLYVVLHRDAVVRDGEVAVDRLREIESSVAGAAGSVNCTRRSASRWRLRLKRPCSQCRQPGAVRYSVRNAQSKEGYHSW